MKRIFIDGKAGTTGLRLTDRLSCRDDISIISLPDELRKDKASRKAALNSCDIAFLCLPDDAARNAVSLTDNPDTVIIDTSTAHRTAKGWTYGFPELYSDGIDRIRCSKRIAVPGCHASGFIAIVKPLIDNGIISKSTALSCSSLTGYSGGGNSMIAQYESADRSSVLSSPRIYGLTQQHKHLKEMTDITGLDTVPSFTPIVADFYSGMLVSVPIFKDNLQGGPGIKEIKELYKEKYGGPIICYSDNPDENGFIASNLLEGKDSMIISVYGNDERISVYALYDNLGKGASGAAVECLNILLGCAPQYSLVL